MRDKKDQVQAHLFLVGRLSSAVVQGDPDAPETPMRRSARGAAGGIALSLIIVAGLVVWGFIRPGVDTSWRTDGAVVIDKDNGIRYVYLDGVLHPTLNQTSARLVAGSADSTVSVSAASLVDEPVGPAVGIVGAPDPLPTLDETSTGPSADWAICATASDERDPVPTVTLVLDRGELAAPVGDGGGVLVTPSGTGELHLVSSTGVRHLVESDAVAAALGLDALEPLEVDPSWLNAFESGSRIGWLDVADLGAPGPAVGGRETFVGQVVVVERVGGVSASYLVLTDGLAPVTQTQALVHLGDTATAGAYPVGDVAPIEVPSADVAAASRVAADVRGSDWPGAVPLLLDPVAAARPCARLQVDEQVSRSLVTIDDFQGAIDVSVGRNGEGFGADRLLARSGTGGILQTEVSGEAVGAVFVYTDLGVKYPVPDGEVLGALGYDGLEPVEVPPEVADFFPTGPALDPDVARRVVTIGPTDTDGSIEDSSGDES